ncbi:hypothetical protein X738_32720 [Mesorhizobium sp. LNHC209A00]|nr:hypothetical protein X738_32720 [Mesorhizobium sp. LNHC209A00]
MILPSLKHLAKPLFQSQKLLWTGRRLVSSTIEQRPERLGHVLLKAHSPGLDRLPVFQAGVLHLRQSCYTGWITISRVHTSLTSNCIVKVLRQFTQRVIELRFLRRAPPLLPSRAPAPGGRLSGFQTCVSECDPKNIAPSSILMVADL